VFLSLLLLKNARAHESDNNECILLGFAYPVSSVDVGNNPYGMVVIPETYGQFHSGDLLVSNWNDPTNQLFGQGNLIKQIRNKIVVRNITIDKTKQSIGVCANDNVMGTGLGFTMAMAYIGKGKIIQCSIPISFNLEVDATNDDGTKYPPFPGCCLIINDAGTVLATFRGNGINGPWGATSYITEYNDVTKVTLFISNVLGPSNSVLTNNNGMVSRYKFELPDNDNDWVSGSDDHIVGTLGNHTVMIDDLNSTPVTISAGTVGPSGLAFLPNDNILIVADTLGGTSDEGRLLKINNALLCDYHNCAMNTLFSSCGTNQCFNPIGINWANHYRALLVANGGDGNLVQYNKQGTEICHIIGDADGGGILFNVVSIPAGNEKHQVAFVDDSQNNVMFLSAFGSNY